MMLQQTQVSRVIDYYRPWIRRFPNWTSLANAKTEALIRAWAGLGYNRRALYMRDAARKVVQNGVPTSIDGWKGLKGIGPYTAAAIYAFTTHTPAIAIDTNIRRVIGRAWLGIPFPESDDEKRITRVLHQSLGPKSGWKALHALMDLGADACSNTRPQCSGCPLRSRCKAKAIVHAGNNRPRKKMGERIRNGKRYPDRIYRGRILKAVREKRVVHTQAIGQFVDETFHKQRDMRWMMSIVQRLIADGLLQQTKGRVKLPK
jgi:A/G-specific adenine glycosylase